MLQKHQKHSFISYSLILWGLFIAVLVTQNIFFGLQENLDKKSQVSSELKQARDTLTQLESDKQNIAQNLDEINRYTQWLPIA